ncbi:hypothetical protein Ahy_B05g075075 [Arachis hypogaea]|uniref:Uncharacterized protein n=1 Tax=Arachis hypogaea TaxID=3818 RepID=A0A444Z0G0_ARAHY|nr:hypothetical protein Ahy_B05g075075 [Arachis hypogaea]
MASTRAPWARFHKTIRSYSRTEQEYNKNYQRLKEWGEAYNQWCDDIGVERWVLAFDGGHRWGHMMTNLVEYINSVPTLQETLLKSTANRRLSRL